MVNPGALSSGPLGSLAWEETPGGVTVPPAPKFPAALNLIGKRNLSLPAFPSCPRAQFFPDNPRPNGLDKAKGPSENSRGQIRDPLQANGSRYLTGQRAIKGTRTKGYPEAVYNPRFNGSRHRPPTTSPVRGMNPFGMLSGPRPQRCGDESIDPGAPAL